MRKRDFERIVREHNGAGLHDGWAVCRCEFAARIRAEAGQQWSRLLYDLNAEEQR